jgi:ADP-heptose:LPS heptosyltransferase/GT2 family glycosyltransferase
MREIPIKPGQGVGDHLFPTSVFPLIKEAYPDSKLLVCAIHKEVYEGNPFVDGFTDKGVFLQYPDPISGKKPTQHHIRSVWEIICKSFKLELPEPELKPQIFLHHASNKENFIAVQTLHKKQWHGKKVWPYFEQLSKLHGFKAIPQCKNLKELVSFLSSAQAVVCSEGAISHLARALDLPAIVLYGGFAKPEWNGYKEQTNIVNPKKCGPCYHRHPCTDSFSCMKELTLDMVASIADAFVGKTQKSWFPEISISIACYNKADLTKKCIQHIQENSKLDQIEVTFVDNASSDETAELLKIQHFPNQKVITNAENLGFGIAHNQALEQASGSIFVVLNNDLFIKDPYWIYKIRNSLRDHSIGLVGLEGTPCSLRNDATGHKGSAIDYIEGSLLALRREDAKTFGLFSPFIEKFCYEDSDLSMRFKQIGKRVKHIHIEYEHQSHSTQNILQREWRDKIVARNQQVFLTRWRSYLSKKKFSNHIYVKMPSVGIGDIVLFTPVLFALKSIHPTVRITVASKFPEVFLNNPIVNTHLSLVAPVPRDVDRQIVLDPNYAEKDPIHKLCEKAIAGHVLDGRPRLYLTAKEISHTHKWIKPLKDKKIIVFSYTNHRTNWHGRNWILGEAEQLVQKLVDNGYNVIEIGKDTKSTGKASLDLVNKTSLRELMALISMADLYVGIDSLPFHIAQAFMIPSVILFGATNPESRIINPSLVYPVQHSCECKGCYHVKKTKNMNRCEKNNEQCMKIPHGDVFHAIMKTLQ